MIEFSIVDWAAWAPGLSERSQWLGWAEAPYLPHGGDTPALAEVPAMQRRRIERLGRMAIQTACWCEDGQGADSDVPLVFASRHGDVARSMDLLGSLAASEPLSPTGFGLSVHNAIAALYSIARGHRGNYLALAAGQATVEAACLEAVALLADGAREVRVVVYESPLPEVYATFADERPVLRLVLAFDRASRGPADAGAAVAAGRRPGQHCTRPAAARAGPASLPVVRRASAGARGPWPALALGPP